MWWAGMDTPDWLVRRRFERKHWVPNPDKPGWSMKNPAFLKALAEARLQMLAEGTHGRAG